MATGMDDDVLRGGRTRHEANGVRFQATHPEGQRHSQGGDQGWTAGLRASSVTTCGSEPTATPEHAHTLIGLRAGRADPSVQVIHISEPTRRTPISYAVF